MPDPRNISEVLLSKRPTARLGALYAIIITEPNGLEGVLRRETSVGTLPWITDDPSLLAPMLTMARTWFPAATLSTASFTRVAAPETLP